MRLHSSQLPTTSGFRWLAALVDRLPLEEGSWTEAERQRWLTAWTTAVDYLIEVKG